METYQVPAGGASNPSSSRGSRPRPSRQLGQATGLLHLPEQLAETLQLGPRLADADRSLLPLLAVGGAAGLALERPRPGREAPGAVRQGRLAEALPPPGRQPLRLLLVEPARRHPARVLRP